MWVMSPRGSVEEGEMYTVTAMAFTRQPLPANCVVVHYREAGQQQWTTITMAQVPGRQVFSASLPPSAVKSGGLVEWFVLAGGESGLAFPPGGSAAPFTVAVL